MSPYRGFRFPKAIIQHAVWLYLRFTLSLRDVEQLLAELRDDNKQLAFQLKRTHDLCDKHDDVATASLLETWLDEAERRVWFLFEAGRPQGTGA